MNMILLFNSDFIGENKIILKDRRFEHILNVHKAKPGDTLKIGLLNNKLGTGVITSLDDTSLTMNTDLTETPPEPLNCALVLAMPRPLMFKRILMHICTLGIKEIHLLHSKRVEKSFWGSPVLEEDNINNELYLGLEQACDTILPKIFIHKRFKEFIETTGKDLASDNRALIAHPGFDNQQTESTAENTVAAIGPEGGFIDYEIDKFIETGFIPVNLGSRILRVETAVPVMVSKIMKF
ncbi:MAG: 16S rRNA (uracil(1498)-N(3))-methyltransferase [Melioribacteraceae bacterium]|nr:16S rRNA (uracil(1498)-N(3))-methyltransferase [Melioribacteraceae bacterium]